MSAARGLVLLSPHGWGLRAGMVPERFMSSCSKPPEFRLQMIYLDLT